MLRTPRLVIAAALLSAMLPASLAAQEHPNIAIGLSSESTYDSSGIDNVSLFSGALSIGPIPLGPRYPVSSTLSYGLNAVYNANIWRYVEREDGVEAIPSRGFNLGAGWLVTLGELYHPNYVYNETDDWLYVDPSGAAHKLYQQLHAGENDGDAGVRYSRDNSFVRMTELSNFNWQRIETPDGLIRTFVKRWSRFRLEKLEDRFGNWVKIAYSEAEQLPAPPSPWDAQMRITDSQGRTHWIYLINRPWTGLTIDTIDFEGPDGGRLVWTFDHWVQNRDRSCKDTVPNNNDRIAMPFLTRINRPDGSKFEMLHAGQPAYWDGCASGMYDRPGMISRITLPTGGSIRYDYQRYDFPGSGYPADYYQSATGVKTRKTYDRDGTLIGTTEYFTTRHVSPFKEMETRVVYPSGACSRHFFEADPVAHPGTGEGWDYGLPYTRRFNQNGRFLSSKFYANTSECSGTGNPVRTTWIEFAHDPLPGLGDDPSNYYNTNRRVAATRTTFHDAGDRYIDTAMSNYDGVGHYRTTTTTSDDAFTPDRTVKTNFNPGRSPWTPWPVGAPWILGTFDWTQQYNSDGVGKLLARVQYEFDSNTGVLKCQRILKAGTNRWGNDIVTEYKRNGAGNVWQVRTRGGDGAGLPTNVLCAGSGGAGANFQYTVGVRRKVRPIGTDGSLMPYFTYDADIDAGTGWVMATRDPSGLETSYSYDGLGRVTQVTPQEGASSSTTYTHGTGPSRAKIRTTVTGAGSTLSDSIVIFDGLGRAVQSRRRTPDHGWVDTYTTYDAAGRVLSRTLPNDSSKKVRYMNYDPFGRPGIIRPPEGAGHDVQMTYSGVFTVERSVKVGTAGGKVYQTWVQRYDGLGRLRIVIEPGAIVGQETGESLRAGYGYDVAGRLTEVRTVDGANDIEQERTFVYDNRGFLLSESHPELGGSGQGSFGYSGYDVFGNPGRVLNNSRDLRYTYDAFGRLTQVRDGQNGNRLVKEFAYDTAVGRGEGKLAEAVRHNWVTPPGEALQDVQVAETYVYQGTAGALSSRTTYIGRAGGLEFEEQYAYDTAGQLIGLTYPECRHEPHICGGSPPRTVNFTYNLGHLRTVSGFTGSGITYHPDGSWATIPHGNGVTDLRDVQTGNPGRTARLYSTGASSNYNSGFFSYDGAGHIIQMGNQAYVYDAVGRLKGKGTKTGGTWNPPGPQIDWEWRYQYDAFGNLNQHRRDFPDGTSQTRSFAIDVNKNRLASANYDTTGNLLSWGGGSYGYDESGNLQAPHSNLAYLYTASDERIGRIYVFDGTQYDEYTLRSASGQVLRELWREDSFSDGTVGWNRDYVWRGGQLLATVHTYYATDPADTRHYTLNHLGSPALVTDGAGQKMARYAEAPFGEDMTSSSDQNYFQLRFTGHERDYHGLGVLDDLDYMHARHYAPYVGRFLQIDPVLGSTGSPQSWNRYAYVRNDPVNLTDPRGQLAAPVSLLRAWQGQCSLGGCITVTAKDPGSGGSGGATITVTGSSGGPGVNWGGIEHSLINANGSEMVLGNVAPRYYRMEIVTEIFPPDPNSGVKSDQTVVVDTETGQIKTNESETGHTDFCPGEWECLVPARFPQFDAAVLEDDADSLTLEVTGETGSWGYPFGNINYAFTVTFDRSSGRISLGGSHDGYPSYLVLIGAEAIYYHEQGRLRELSGCCDVQVGD